MSLTGYLPPISENGSLLADGGYMSVLPCDVMKEQAGARTVISVDVSSENQKDYYEYGTYLSGWWLLWNSLNPFSKTVNVPSMGDIQDALRWVSSDQHRRRMETVADLHLRPPIQDFGTLEYDKFDEIVERGYDHAKPLVEELVRKNPSLVSSSRMSPRKLKEA
jgi:lysophospholipid hydrolase